MKELYNLDPGLLFLIGAIVLLLATQLVIVVLNKLEQHQFGPVYLGTLITPLCTGFPNLMLGLFGRERLQGDLVLQLNIGNNLANTTLITGLILFLAGPLEVRPGRVRGKKAGKWNREQFLALLFLWLAAVLLFFLARDGRVGVRDGFGLCSIYLVYHLVAFKNRGRVTRGKQLSRPAGILIFGLLGVAAVLIYQSIELMAMAMERVGDFFQGTRLGLFLGLLTVIPESFLLLRLAMKKGSLGFSGLAGDCFVSIPLVIGISAVFFPFDTPPVPHLRVSAVIPYLHLFVAMLAFSLLTLRKRPLPRKTGLLFMALYAMVWWHASG